MLGAFNDERDLTIFVNSISELVIARVMELLQDRGSVITQLATVDSVASPNATVLIDGDTTTSTYRNYTNQTLAKDDRVVVMFDINGNNGFIAFKR